MSWIVNITTYPNLFTDSNVQMLVLGSEIKEYSVKFQIGTQELGNLIYIE